MIRSFFKNHIHALWALFFVGYLAFFFLVESIEPLGDLHWMYHAWDDKIPFCEYFIIAYDLWYPFLAIPAVFMIFLDGAAFRRYVWYVGIGFTLTLVFCLIYPNGQLLRPDLAELGRENLFTGMLGMTYAADTNTNVCPSMHVIGSIGVFISVLDCKKMRKTVWVPIVCGVLAFLISISTVFVKQHSIVDVFWGVIASAILFVIVYIFLHPLADRLEAYQKRKLLALAEHTESYNNAK